MDNPQSDCARVQTISAKSARSAWQRARRVAVETIDHVQCERQFRAQGEGVKCRPRPYSLFFSEIYLSHIPFWEYLPANRTL